MTQEAFKAWWLAKAVTPHIRTMNCEEVLTMRMCEIAWANGRIQGKRNLGTDARASWLVHRWVWRCANWFSRTKV
jgi:hypothetical protein